LSRKDILELMDAVNLLGGLSWKVKYWN
jgi:hypothetical protein